MMKNSLLMLFCLLLALPFACMAEESAEPAMPVFEWERNPAGHWRMLENGERADLDIHKFDDSLCCTVCGAEVWVYDDLSGEVYNYDAFGNMIRQTSYASDGTITYDSVRALTYDENGNLTHALEFIDGVLFGESTFAISPDGEIIPVTEHAWYDDGTWALNEYDEYGNCIRAVSCAADDSILSEIISEYKRGDWGWFYESKRTTYMDDAVFSVGSDGTDGPTDAAGGYTDHTTKAVLAEQGIDIYQVLQQNDAYHALQKSDGLVMTGATGTNVNDVAVLLIKR